MISYLSKGEFKNYYKGCLIIKSQLFKYSSSEGWGDTYQCGV